MTDRFLFITAPYAAAAAVPAVLLLRYLHGLRRGRDLHAERAGATQAFRGGLSWRYPLLLLFVGHGLGLLLPMHVVSWNDVPWRLFVLEGTAFLAGTWALLALLQLLRRGLFETGARAVRQPADLALLSVLFVQIVSGLAVAALYRWASSWSTVTLTPYMLSLIQLRPRLDLITSMPYLVKLHVFSATAAIAVLPWTSLAHLVIHPVHRALEILGRPVATVAAQAGPRVGQWRDRATVATTTWWDDED